MIFMSWFVFTPEQRDRVLEESEGIDFRINPRLIDGENVESLNDPILIRGNYVASSLILSGETGDYWGDKWVAELPMRNAESGILFAPQPDW